MPDLLKTLVSLPPFPGLAAPPVAMRRDNSARQPSRGVDPVAAPVAVTAASYAMPVPARVSAPKDPARPTGPPPTFEANLLETERAKNALPQPLHFGAAPPPDSIYADGPAKTPTKAEWLTMTDVHVVMSQDSTFDLLR